MAVRRRGRAQDFLINNHADLVAGLVALLLLGIMFEVTAKTVFIFISPQYNISSPTADGETVLYQSGVRDLLTVLFYFFIAIILHAVIQEYVLDKVNKRLHLSKIKQNKFSESGQLLTFHLISAVWGLSTVLTEGYLVKPSSLWEDYPHTNMSFQVKFYFLSHMAYWLHSLPELYFQRVRKEDLPRQLLHISLYLLHLSGAYLIQLTRVGLVLVVVHSLPEIIFHAARLGHYIHESHQRLFGLWAVVFGICRLVTVTLTVLTVGFGLSRAPHPHPHPHPHRATFNSVLLRLCVLGTVCYTQGSMMWKFINFQLRRWRQNRQENSAGKHLQPSPPPGKQRAPRRGETGGSDCPMYKLSPDDGSSPRTRRAKSA